MKAPNNPELVQDILGILPNLSSADVQTVINIFANSLEISRSMWNFQVNVDPQSLPNDGIGLLPMRMQHQMGAYSSNKMTSSSFHTCEHEGVVYVLGVVNNNATRKFRPPEGYLQSPPISNGVTGLHWMASDQLMNDAEIQIMYKNNPKGYETVLCQYIREQLQEQGLDSMTNDQILASAEHLKLYFKPRNPQQIKGDENPLHGAHRKSLDEVGLKTTDQNPTDIYSGDLCNKANGRYGHGHSYHFNEGQVAQLPVLKPDFSCEILGAAWIPAHQIQHYQESGLRFTGEQVITLHTGVRDDKTRELKEIIQSELKCQEFEIAPHYSHRVSKSIRSHRNRNVQDLSASEFKNPREFFIATRAYYEALKISTPRLDGLRNYYANEDRWEVGVEAATHHHALLFAIVTFKELRQSGATQAQHEEKLDAQLPVKLSEFKGRLVDNYTLPEQKIEPQNVPQCVPLSKK